MNISMSDKDALRGKTTGLDTQTRRGGARNETEGNSAKQAAVVEDHHVPEPRAPLATKFSSIGSLLPASGKEAMDTIAEMGRAEAVVSHLVRGWEALSSDPRRNFEQPMQMMQDLDFCGPGPQSFTTLTYPPHPLDPPALRHTHSSPLQYRPSIFDDEQNLNVPPPVPLDPFLRSSSTPSSFRQNSIGSAFGPADRSAFTLPSQQRVAHSLRDPGEGRVSSAFDPVKYYAKALEDMERTSIEVTDLSPLNLQDAAEPAVEEVKTGARGAAFRAKRFLSDVRTLRRRRRGTRGGRDIPAQPPSVASDGSPPILDTSITVFTEADYNPANPSHLSNNSELSAIVKNGNDTSCEDEPAPPTPERDNAHGEEIKHEVSPIRDYQQLDSDVDEEEDHYQRIETQLQPDSPGTVPSPTYEQILDERPSASPVPAAFKENETKPGQSIRIHMEKAQVALHPSPSPTRMAGGAGMSRSSESETQSPGTTTSFRTGSSSGHTTQATSTSLSTGPNAGLSTISETDREVMEANQEGKRLRGLEGLTTSRKIDSDGISIHSSSTGTNSTNPHGYLALAGSPGSLREGANVPAERFFTNSPTGGTHPPSYTRTYTMSSSSRRSGSGTTSSPGTLGSGSITNTTSSTTSSREEPPTFVSYLDREGNSDLTSLREGTECSSQRASNQEQEEREASPAEIGGYLGVLFEAAESPREQVDDGLANTTNIPNMPLSVKQLRSWNERVRSLPPRSPAKGLRPLTTPPPRVSPICHHPSPPRNIVDHPESHVTRPYVMRKAYSGGHPYVLSSPLQTYNNSNSSSGYCSYSYDWDNSNHVRIHL